MNSNPKALEHVKRALKNDNIIGELCSKMLKAYKLGKHELVKQYNKLYKERQLELVKIYMNHYNKNTIMLFLEDIELK